MTAHNFGSFWSRLFCIKLGYSISFLRNSVERLNWMKQIQIFLFLFWIHSINGQNISIVYNQCQAKTNHLHPWATRQTDFFTGKIILKTFWSSCNQDLIERWNKLFKINYLEPSRPVKLNWSLSSFVLEKFFSFFVLDPRIFRSHSEIINIAGKYLLKGNKKQDH